MLNPTFIRFTFFIEIILYLVSTKNIIATYVYHNISDNFFIEFSNVSRNPNEEKLFKLWENLKIELENLNDELSNSIINHLKESIDDFYTMKQNEDYFNRAIYT